VSLVNLLAALNFANVFKNKKKRLENKKTFKNVKNVTKKQTFFYIYGVNSSLSLRIAPPRQTCGFRQTVNKFKSSSADFVFA